MRKRASAQGNARATAAGRELCVAAVQMRTDSIDTAGNFSRAEGFVREAAAGGARLVLLPEFFGCGYTYELRVRGTSEPLDGPTGSFLGRLAAELGIWLGGCFYEGTLGGCFDTFLLVGPHGQRHAHRKRTPAAFEWFFFEPGADPLVVETDLGRVALVICAESIYPDLLAEVAATRPDLILIGYSSPGPTAAVARLLGGPPSDYLRRVPKRWARTCGAPVAVACVTGEWCTGLPGVPLFRLRLPFFGRSGIYGADGKTLAAVDQDEGVVRASVALGAVEPAMSPPAGATVEPLPPAILFLLRATQWVGASSYARWRARAH